MSLLPDERTQENGSARRRTKKNTCLGEGGRASLALPQHMMRHGNEAFRITVELLNIVYERGGPYPKLLSSTSTTTVSEAFAPRRRLDW